MSTESTITEEITFFPPKIKSKTWINKATGEKIAFIQYNYAENDALHKIEKNNYKNEELISIDTYDSNKQLIFRTLYNNDNTYTKEIPHYTRDKKIHQLQQFTYKNNTIISEKIYNYNDDGNITEIDTHTRNNRGNRIASTYCSYNPQFQLIHKETCDSKGMISSKEDYSYENNNVQIITQKYENGIKISEDTVQTTKNRITQIVKAKKPKIPAQYFGNSR